MSVGTSEEKFIPRSHSPNFRSRWHRSPDNPALEKAKRLIMASPDNMASPGRREPERRRVVPARDARQGVTGHNVRYVLGFSLFALIIVFGVIWLVYFA
jgi:hypothetical protein